METQHVPTTLETRGMAGQQPGCTVANLKKFWDAESAKTSAAKKVRFVDCQDDASNAKWQMAKALHVYMSESAPPMVVWPALAAQKPAELEDLYSADLVVFYCYQGSNRSPGLLKEYVAAYKATTGPKKANQQSCFLVGGMSEYAAAKPQVGIVPWVSPAKAKVVLARGTAPSGAPIGPKPTAPTKLPQPGSDPTNAPGFLVYRE